MATFLQDMEDCLPLIAEEGLADFVDAFVEKGYFEVEDCQATFTPHKDLGLKFESTPMSSRIAACISIRRVASDEC